MLYKVEVQPFHDFVIVRTIDNPETVTPGGIIIPNTADKQPLCQVVGFGDGITGNPATDPRGKLQVGDIVVLQRYTGTKIMLNGHVVQFVKWYDIQGKVKYTVAESGEEFRPSIPEDYFNSKPERSGDHVLSKGILKAIS
jgi:co-chaperonin GroES (HSP10)